MLAEWFAERDIEEVVMESTALYWGPVWDALERQWQPTRGRRAGPGHKAGARVGTLWRASGSRRGVPPPRLDRRRARCISRRRSRTRDRAAGRKISLMRSDWGNGWARTNALRPLCPMYRTPS